MQATCEAPGVIEPGRLYTAAEVKARLRIGPKVWKELRDAGLPVAYRGRHAFVMGDDIISALRATKTAGVATA